ncbi:hypothetical protein [Cyclobacterium plantarum]|uniref:Uncharacterized protein n=1 Tax=Cyclobacterium plantarum TaxID=2716263 RepID=A0ABX0HFS3_9BACT|nr:hypothetical protein [Cyclobacterium plantarum]NHE59813.1 hypothetical protein [Cyclobacterium plantarum]
MFDLDIITLSMAMVAIIAFIMPFYINNKKVKAKVALAEKLLADFAKNQQLNIQVKDLWRNKYFIGIDPQKGKLIYSEDINSCLPVLIDLHLIGHVRIKEESHKVVSPTSTRKVIDKLELSFYSEKAELFHNIEFYDGEKFSDLLGETILIKKWENEIMACMQQLTKKASIL